jgi:crotonobetaine/carnitine-CoA ligase
VVGVCSTARADVYRAAVDEAGARDLHVIEVDEADVDLAPFGERLLADWPAVSLHDRAAVMFTSGTTGLPKGVEVTQANYAFAGKVMAEAAVLRPEHRQLVVLPLFHANAQYYSFASAIWVGASVALMPTFSASRFIEQARVHGATHASLFAAPMRMILARGITDETEPVQLTNCWYAQNITDEQHATLSRVLGCAPRQLYGMTETIPAVLTDEVEHPVPTSMGFVSPGCEVDVQDGDGASMPPGAVGEIVVRGEPGITLFAGYLDMPDVTAESYRNQWFRTGDRATRDADGRYRFDGRRSDVLKVSGENVSIVEVESVLAGHPGVLEAAVVGRADPIRDEVPVAFVVPRDPADPPSVESLQAWCEERLSKPKRPHEFTLLDELPRTSVGKIRKFLLADQAASHVTSPAAGSADREG